MSRVPWHLFKDRQPRAHLVVGALVQTDEPVGGDELTAAQFVLTRLARKHAPACDYAATMVRDTGRREVYFAFATRPRPESSLPPCRLKRATAIQAGRASGHSSWTARGWRIWRASLPPPRKRPRREQIDQSAL